MPARQRVVPEVGRGRALEDDVEKSNLAARISILRTCPRKAFKAPIPGVILTHQIHDCYKSSHAEKCPNVFAHWISDTSCGKRKLVPTLRMVAICSIHTKHKSNAQLDQDDIDAEQDLEKEEEKATFRLLGVAKAILVNADTVERPYKTDNGESKERYLASDKISTLPHVSASGSAYESYTHAPVIVSPGVLRWNC